MKVGFLITARLKSTRLPKKLVLKINDLEIIRWMIRRIKLSKSISDIVICTSTNPQDDELESIARSENIKCFRGDENDVLSRLNEATKFYQFDYILNITADCPLVAIEYFPVIIKTFKDSNADLIQCLDLPHGFFSYGISVSALDYICKNKEGKNTEVWGKYFTENTNLKVIDIQIPDYFVRPDYRLTLDYKDDFELFKKVFERFGEDTFRLCMADIIYFLDENPDIAKINKNCKELFRARWEAQNKIGL